MDLYKGTIHGVRMYFEVEIVFNCLKFSIIATNCQIIMTNYQNYVLFSVSLNSPYMMFPKWYHSMGYIMFNTFFFV